MNRTFRKHFLRIFIFLVAVAVMGGASKAYAIDSGSNGSLGNYNPTSNETVVLPADGVLHYGDVTIPTGVTITFEANEDNTPIYLLSNGDITINGTISINGIRGSDYDENPSIVPGGPGAPGGFAGGKGSIANAAKTGVLHWGSDGFGPGGGYACLMTDGTLGDASGGGGGAFAAQGRMGADGMSAACTALPSTPYFRSGLVYGNFFIRPMIGGSGGAGGGVRDVGGYGDNYLNGGAGGGGAGAIMIAANGTISISDTGSVTADGGEGGDSLGIGGGGGAGGAIFFKAQTINTTASATVTAARGVGGAGENTNRGGGLGGTGRIRYEANFSDMNNGHTIASAPSPVFQANMPTLTITALNGESVPASPSGSYDSPDVVLDLTTDNPLTVDIAATNIPTGTTVTVILNPIYKEAISFTSTALTGTEASSTATASVTMPSWATQMIFQANVTFSIEEASLGYPKYAEGEKIEKISVAMEMGGKSKVYYITESGKKVLARM